MAASRIVRRNPRIIATNAAEIAVTRRRRKAWRRWVSVMASLDWFSNNRSEGVARQKMSPLQKVDGRRSPRSSRCGEHRTDTPEAHEPPIRNSCDVVLNGAIIVAAKGTGFLRGRVERQLQ